MNDDSQLRPRTVAFYLPQFHTIAENDEWWGEGFTEWTNVTKSAQLFDGHAQPKTPGSLGYYDLSDPAVVHSQAEMAAANGIDAFCMYFYWFDGKRLLESPLDNYVESGPDFPFCLSWANENWSRRWDGKEHEVLIAQDYGDKTAEDVFMAMVPYLRDSRYVRQNNAPVILVHRADHLPDCKQFVDAWRGFARDIGLGEIYLVAAETSPGLDPRPLGFDAVAEFPPVGANTLSAALIRPPKHLAREFRGRLLSYERLRARFAGRPSERRFVRHAGVMPRWDNSARRGLAATVYAGESPASYAKWLASARAEEQTLRGADGLVFINAWNEWAEGAYLEPDGLWGDAYLAATRHAAPDSLPVAVRYPGGLPSLGFVRSLGMIALSSMLAMARSFRRSTVGRWVR